jgi:hypothetical protein
VNEDPTGLLSSQSSVNITRNLISDLISFANNLAAYVYGLTSNPSQAAQSAKQTANSFAANPSGFASKAASSVASGAAQSATQTWNNINSGDDATQERGITDWIEFSGAVIAGPASGARTAAAKEVPQVLINKATGDAFRDSIAATMRNAGYDVKTEVYMPTGLGARYMDIDVSKNGVNLGGIETKVGTSPYTSSQRAKDAWLKWTQGYVVTVVRNPNP